MMTLRKLAIGVLTLSLFLITSPWSMVALLRHRCLLARGPPVAAPKAR
jgi:hypothetical protein